MWWSSGFITLRNILLPSTGLQDSQVGKVSDYREMMRKNKGTHITGVDTRDQMVKWWSLRRPIRTVPPEKG
jgi:hypothetical protein